MCDNKYHIYSDDNITTLERRIVELELHLKTRESILPLKKRISDLEDKIDKNKLGELAACDYCGVIYLKKSLQKFNDGDRTVHYSFLCKQCAEFAREELRGLY